MSKVRRNRGRVQLVWLAAVFIGAGLQAPAAASPAEGCLTSNINGERRAQGADSLVSNSDLIAIARRHSTRMAKDQRYYHNGNLRNELPSGWRSEGENVGWATDCAHMHNFFMNSPTHRKNILNPVFSHIGVGVVVDSAGKLWVTEVFMESSGPSGLSAEYGATLKAPPPNSPVASAPEHASPAPAVPKKPAATAPKSSSPLASADRSAAPASELQPPLKKGESAPAKRSASTIVFQESVPGEPGWHGPGSDTRPIVFDLEATV